MMGITSEQEMIQKMVKEFSEKELLDLAVQIDKEKKYPKEILEKLAPLGLMGLFIPPEYGGAGSDTISYVLSLIEIAKACASTSVVLAAHSSLVCATLNKFGSDEQKKRFLVPLAQGKTGSFALTDLKETTAVKDKGYVLNGSKKYVINGGEADCYLVVANLDGNDRVFVIMGDSEGLSFGDIEEGIGLKGAMSRPVILDNVKVPQENLIEGDDVKSYALDEFHIALAAICAGICEASLGQSVDYSMERVQFGLPIGAFQAIRWKLARMHEMAQTSRLLAMEAARAKDAGESFSDLSKIAKLYASEAVTWVSKQGVLIHGGTGYTKEVPLERYARDARAMPLIGGSTESILDDLAAKLFE